MYAFIVDELMLATAQEVRRQARLARPHVSRRPARLLAREERGAAGAGAGAGSEVEALARGRGGRR